MKKMMERLAQGATRLLVLALGLGLVATGWGAAIGDKLTFSSIEKVASAATKDGASGVNGFSLTIPDSIELPAGSKVTLQSIKFGRRGATRNYLVLSDDANAAMASTNRIDHTAADSSFGNVAWMQYDFNDIELTVGTPYPAHFRDNANGAAKNQGENINLMTYVGGYQVFAQGSYSTTRIMYYEVKCTVSSIKASVAQPSFRQVGTITTPEGWFTSWDGENFSDDCKAISRGDNVYVAEKDASTSRTPYKNYQAPEEFSFAIYTDASMVEPYEENKKPVLWTFGKSGTANLRLRKDMSSNKLQLVAGNGATDVASVELAIPEGGYHLYTATFSTSGGISLTVDGNTLSTVSDPTVCTRPASGMQIGGMYEGVVDGEAQVKHMPIGVLLGYEKVLGAEEVASLAEDYPAVSSRTLMVSYAEEGHKLYSGTMTSSRRIELDVGTLSIPSGSTLTIPSLRVGNNGNSKAFGIDLDGTLRISGTSTGSDTGQSGSGSIREDVLGDTGGVLLGEWTGAGTYNIRGLLDAENNYVTIYHDAGAQTYNINGGTIKAKGLQCRQYNAGRGGNATVNLTDGGVIEVAEVLSGAGSFTRNYGYGTLRYTGAATETIPINFNAGTGYATTLDPAANTLMLSAGVVTGTGDIAVAPSGAGKVVFASLTDSYSGKVTISSGSAEIQGVSGYMGDIEANAPLTIATGANDVTMASAISGTGAINKTGTGTLMITGSGASSGTVTIKGGMLVLSGNEAKVGTGSFVVKPGTGSSATLKIEPGQGNAITLAPDYIVSSTDGNPALVVGEGTFNVASTGSSANGHFGQCTITIEDGGIMNLTRSGLLGTGVSSGITVEDGGKLQISAYQKLARDVTLNGGSIELTGAATPLEFWGAKTVTATADSEIQAVSSGSNTNPNMWLNSNADGAKVAVTFNVSSSAATLDVNACIVNGTAANSQGNGITKTGPGTLALNGYNGNGYSYSGTTTVSAGTLKINAQQSGSAYDLAAGTTLKFGTGANLSVPSLTLPASGTVTVDVSDLTLSAGGTTLMTFTIPPSADDVANKMSASGVVLVLEGSTLKAYPVATLTYTVNDVTTTNSYSTLNDAISAAYMREYSGNSYDYITINQSGTATAYANSVKVKLASGVTLTVNPGSPENGSYTAGTADENGVITYSSAPLATTYVWVAANDGVWNMIGNWKYMDGEDVQQWATRCPTSVDTVIFNDGATVTLNDTVTVAGIEVNGDVSISATAKSLNTSGNVTTSSSGTLTLSDVCLASAAAGVTVAPAVNFTNDSELAGENALTLLGNVTVCDTFKVLDSSHVISGPVTINSGVTFKYGALLLINGAATVKGAFTRDAGSTSCIKFCGAVTIENGNVRIDGWKLGGLGDAATVVLAGSGASLTDTRGTPITANKVSTTVADSYVKKSDNTYSVAAKRTATVSVGSNASLTINGNAVANGDTLKFVPGDVLTITASADTYYTPALTVNGVAQTSPYQLTTTDADVTVSATATRDTVAITIPSVDNTTVSVSYTSGGAVQVATTAGDITVDAGTDVTATWTAASGYRITSGASETLNGVTSVQTLASPTVEANSVEFSNFAVEYLADYSKAATITATVTGDGATEAKYTLKVGETDYNGTYNSETGKVTFNNVGTLSLGDTLSYTISASGTTSGTSTPQTSTVGNVTPGWVQEDWTHTGNSGTGTWATPVTYTDSKATISDNTYTANTAGNGIVTLTTVVKFGDEADPEVQVGDDAQAAIRIQTVESTPKFQVYGKTKANGAAAWQTTTVPAVAETTYTVSLTINYMTGTFTASVQASGAGSATPLDGPWYLAIDASKISAVAYKGTGEFTSLNGSFISGDIAVTVTPQNDVAVSSAFISQYLGNKTVSDAAAALNPNATQESNPEAFAANGNGINYFTCYALGLNPKVATDKPIVSVVPKAEGGFTVKLTDSEGNALEPAGNVSLTYTLKSGTTPGELSGGDSQSSAEFTVDPPTDTNVKYYQIDVSIGAK